MWWPLQHKLQYTLCCSVTPETITCALFVMQNGHPHIIKHALFAIESPFLIDGQLYNQTILTRTIDTFLENFDHNIPVFLALDNSCSRQQLLVSSSQEAAQEMFIERPGADVPMIYAQTLIWQDDAGLQYWACCALEQQKYFPFLCAFVRSKAQLVVAVPRTVAHMFAFRLVNLLLFQESIVVAQRDWSIRMPDYPQTLIGYCTAEKNDALEIMSEEMLILYGLYSQGSRLYEAR